MIDIERAGLQGAGESAGEATADPGGGKEKAPKLFAWLASLDTILLLIASQFLVRGDKEILRGAGVVVLALSGVFIFAPFFLLLKHGRSKGAETYMQTGAVVDRGLYALIRHPQYLGYMLLAGGFALLSQHLLAYLLAAIGVACFYIQAVQEEKHCLARFGEAYAAYLRRVPRFNLLLGALRFLLLLTILLAACQPSLPPTPMPTTNMLAPDPFGAVRAGIERLVADGEVPSITVAVARDGEIIWEEGFGLADREKNIPATEHTPYPLASISKPLTATGLMILVERGLVDLDSPVNDYLGEAKLLARVGDAAEATVRRVASHTAGLPLHSQHFYDGEPYQPPSMDETIRRYGNLITVPGERYQYSNLGYGFLGYVISRVSGSSYADFMREEVFVPLGMEHTSVHVGPGLEAGQAVRYTPAGAVVPLCDSDSPGASAIYGSAHDLVRFAMLHFKNRLPDQRAIITESAVDEMQRPSPETGPTREWEREGSGYGIGWFAGITEDGVRVVQHSGWTSGVSAVLALVPEENLAVVVLSNTDSQWPDAILIEILCTLLSGRPEEFLPPADTAADEPPFAPGPELVGSWEGFVHTYEREVPLVLEIGESGCIHATLGGQPRTLLQSASYQDSLPQFLNAGGGPFLRGWMRAELETADVNRGRPYKLWLELKLREGLLNGTLVAFSQREMPIGPLAHWVELIKR